MKSRTCPHCLVYIPMDSGFHFDSSLNLICDKCEKVVISVNEKNNVEIFSKGPTDFYPTHHARAQASNLGNLGNIGDLVNSLHPDA